MARIRTIKPEFWTDAKTGTLPEFSKCLFLGLLNHADDYGVLEWSPAEWRAKIFPYHSDTTTGAVQKALLDDLLPLGLLVMFAFTDDEGETKQYAFIQNFHRHQVINKPSRPLLKGWKLGDNPKTYSAKSGIEFEELAPFDQGPIPHPSGSPPVGLRPGKERKGEEGKGEEKQDAANAALDPSIDQRDYYRRGKQVCGETAGGMLKNLLKAKGGNTALARSVVEVASTKQNAREYVAAAVHGPPSQSRPPDV